MERTLVILKPGALQRGLVGEVISRFEQNRSLLPELSQNARQCFLEKYAQRVAIHIFRQLIQA